MADENADGLRKRSSASIRRQAEKNTLSASASSTVPSTIPELPSDASPTPSDASPTPTDPLAEVNPSPDPNTATDELDKNILVLIKEYGRTVLILMVAWVVGYFNFSATWLMVGLFVFMWRQQRRIRNTFKDQIQQRAALLDERTAISRVARVEDLPSWVYFPDVERAEWMNKIVKQLWPYIGDYVQTLLKESIEPMIQEMIVEYGLEKFEFGTVTLGDIAPRIGGVKVYTENVKRDEIIMDMEIFYAGDAEVSVTIKKLGFPITAGLKNMKMHGTMRCEMKPLCKQIPLVGALTCFFLYNPTIDFDLTNLANLLDAPVLSATLHNIIAEFVAQLMVLPNRFPIKLIESINTTLLNYPLPKGVLRIHVVEASELIKSDTFGKSDPYVNVEVGAQKRKTHVVKKDLNPVWNEVFEFVVNEISGQMLEVQVYDKDDGDRDDFLGRYDFDIEKIARVGYMDDWFPLEQIKKGKIHIRLLWLNFSLDKTHIKKITSLPEIVQQGLVFNPSVLPTYEPDPLIESDIQASGAQVKSTEKLSCAFLMVHLDSAKNLPMGKKAKSEPSPRATLTVKGGGTSSEQISQIKPKTQDPRWEEAFKFLIHNPEIQDLVISVSDSEDKDHVMGEYTFHINELFKEEDMVIEARPFYITNNATVTMRLCLRILHAGALPVDAPEVGELAAEKEGSPEDPQDNLFTKLEEPAAPAAAAAAAATSEVVAPKPKLTLQSVPGAPPAHVTPERKEPAPEPHQPLPSVVEVRPATSTSTPATTATPATPATPPSKGRSGDVTVVADDDDITREIGGVADLMERDREATPKRPDDVISVMTSNSISESISAISAVQNRYVISHGKEDYDSDGEEDLGRIQLTLRYAVQRNQLVVVVHKCTHLIPCDKKGNTDPYVRLYLLPDRSKYGKQKTVIKEDDLDPVFEETFNFNISLEEAEKRVLDVCVKNDCSVFSREKKEIGRCFIKLNDFQLTQASTRWFDLCDPENAKN